MGIEMQGANAAKAVEKGLLPRLRRAVAEVAETVRNAVTKDAVELGGNLKRAGKVPATSSAAQLWKLRDVAYHEGPPSDGYKHVSRYLDATTAKRGAVWILDDARQGARILHNTQEMSNPKKIGEIVKSLEETLQRTDDQILQEVLPEFIALIRKKHPGI